MTQRGDVAHLPRLHLGAFNCAVDGWINTDVTQHLWISRIPFAADILRFAGVINAERYREHKQGLFRKLHYMDLTKRLPYADNSLSAIFSAHVFEHLFPDEIGRLVRESYRVLAPGGICRVVVPDLERIVGTYDAENPHEFIRQMFEAETRKTAAFAHHWAFTRTSLVTMFKDAGFSNAQATSYRVGRCPDIDRLDNRPDESIFFEAVK